jgi:hypothetical protein
MTIQIIHWRVITTISIIIMLFSIIASILLPFLSFGGAAGGINWALLISVVTCFVSTVSTFSSLWLSWRADRRQAREADLKIAQLEIQLKEARSKYNGE